MKNNLGIIIGALISMHSISDASIIVKGNNTTASPYGFTAPISTRILDPFSGIFYVGLNNYTVDNAYALSKAGRYNGQPAPSFTGFAPSELQNANINYLSLSPVSNSAANLVGSASSTAGTNGTVFIVQNDGTKFSSTPTLNDSTGASTGGVSGVAANGNYIVAAVNASSTSGWNTTTAGGGLALVQINNNLTLTPKNALTGTNGNLAVPLDFSAPAFIGTGGANVTINDAAPQILWDQQLGCFYIGISMTSGITAGNQALAVTVATIQSPANDIALVQIVNPSILSGGTNNIVVAESGGSNVQLLIKKMAILHASTGPSYLIVAGGNTIGSTNNIYALPLVDDPTSITNNGTLANKNSALSASGKFTVPAGNAADLAILPTDAAAATVGATALPISTIGNLSDMVVVGDTVYASISVTDSTNDPGIFYSQALFDSTGKIIGWTPWTKKVIPTNAFPNVLMPDNLAFDGTIAFFQVDLANGKVWYVDNQTKQVVGSTSWTSAIYAPAGSLAYELDNALPTGVEVALDLDQGTRGFTDNQDANNGTLARYALFGGNGAVVFARTSVVANAVVGTTISALNSVQTAQTDFTNSENFLVTQLPKNAGICQTLEYSRQLSAQTNSNYFFAGTSNGLYAFADTNQAGFTIATANVNELNKAPFTGQWYTIPTITGSVTAIRTSGNALYILTQQAIPTLQSTIYKIPFTDNLSTMFVSSNITIIAQTGNTVAPNSGLYTNFKNISVFNDIAITFPGTFGSPTPPPLDPTAEQLLIATSNDLYISEAASGINNATSSNDALWHSVDISKTGLPFLGIATVDNAAIGTANIAPSSIFPTTNWPFALTNPYNNGIFNTGTIYQVNSSLSNTTDYVPLIFTSINGDAAFSQLNPVINFNTDGARRFFVLNMDKNNRLMSLPFDAHTWNIQNQTHALVNDPQLATIHAIYWIRPIGSTGTLFMGTNKGVYTLN